MRARPFFKSLTDDDSLIPFPVNSLTKRNRDRKNVQTKYQPITTRRNTINRLNITENAVRKISIEISIGISIKETRNEEKDKTRKRFPYVLRDGITSSIGRRRGASSRASSTMHVLAIQRSRKSNPGYRDDHARRVLALPLITLDTPF